MRYASQQPNPAGGSPLLAVAWKAIRVRLALFALLVIGSAACGGNGSPDPLVGVPGAQDSTPPPTTPDTAAGDTTDSVPGPDSLVPPPDSTPNETPGPVSHEGLPFGPAQLPAERFADFSGTVYTATNPTKLIADLEGARRTGARLFISFAGSEQFNRDENGFSISKWEHRVDRFRGLDLTPYIAEGTIIGHFILDEPQDPTNWNGHRVSPAQIEEIAAYSKQIWPTMATVVRAFPDYLKGYEYPHLDALRIQYLDRFAPLDDFIEAQVEGAKALGLGLVGGLNVLNGGSKNSGIPGQRAGKNAMSAEEIRAWGGRFLSDPYLCGFLMYQYDQTYFSRPDIQDALSDLAQQARSLPQKSCHR
jgi:hypothetical protein